MGRIGRESPIPKIIYEDRHVLVIDKPAGMPSVSLMEGGEETLAGWISEKSPNCADVGKKGEAGLVHRLDNDTSGVIVAAKTNAAYEKLRAQFERGEAKKEYTALVVGAAPSGGCIDFPIAHHPRKKRKMVVCRSDAEAKKYRARSALTTFKLVERYNFEGARYSLLSVEIRTGVRHQIRAHLASIGHPIAGDSLYQNPKQKEMDILGLTRHFLHASRIEFAHPGSGKIVGFASPLLLMRPIIRN